ncbi:MAG: tetraacyldisaccharide 4'-kinase [bacterium]
MTPAKTSKNPMFQPPLWSRPFLFPVGLAYWILVRFRLFLFRIGVLRQTRASRPVIAVGNLTVGGTGKTPMVDFLVRESQRAGKRPVVLSRGHGRLGRSRLSRSRSDEQWAPDAVALGDEPALLSLRNPGVAVYVGKQRTETARLAILWDAPDLIILDDAYQHLRLARDLNVLLIDGEQGLGNGRMLPLGPLREPAGAIGRADVVLLTKTAAGEASPVREMLAPHLAAHVPVFTCQYQPRLLGVLDGSREFSPDALRDQTVCLVCGIARPDGFITTVEALGARVDKVWALPDHHPYHLEDLRVLDEALDEVTGEVVDAEKHEHWNNTDSTALPGLPGLPLWLTTEKDAVKLRGRLKTPGRLGVLEMAMVPEPDAQAFFFDFIQKCGII